MPNWCNNTVIVDGNKKEIQRFIKYVKNPFTKAPLSFQTILPMPRELERTQSPAVIVTQEEYTKWRTQAEFNPHHGEQAMITQEMSDNLKAKYGTDNWYDWKMANWGTKWEIGNDDITTIFEDTHLSYNFDTAWSPPEGIYVELVKQFPTLIIDWHYSEEGMEMFGNLATETEVTDTSDVNSELAILLTHTVGEWERK